VTILGHFYDRADEHPDRVAIIEASDRSATYGDLKRRSVELAAAWSKQGILPGDRVLVAVWPGIELYASLAAIWRLGATAVLPEASMGLKGFLHAAEASKPKALLAGPGICLLSRFIPETRGIPLRISPYARGSRTVAPVAPIGNDTPALISFTSGTTGKPKGIVRTHGLLLAQHEALASIIAPKDRPEIDLVAFPAFVLTCLGHGTTAVMPDWDVRRHDMVNVGQIGVQARRMAVTRLLVPPVITARIADERLIAPTVRRVMTGGGPVYPDVARAFLRANPGMGLTIVYGSTEAEPISHVEAESLSEDDWSLAANGGGLPAGDVVPEAALRIVDGEIQVAGGHVNEGYMDPARDAETKVRVDGVVYHRTGDAGRIDDKGRLWLLGRTSASVEGIHPFAVETAARLQPGVTNAAFLAHAGLRVLFVEGEDIVLDRSFRQRLKETGVLVQKVGAMPMDSRHRSKPDYAKLRRKVKVRSLLIGGAAAFRRITGAQSGPE